MRTYIPPLAIIVFACVIVTLMLFGSTGSQAALPTGAYPAYPTHEMRLPLIYLRPYP